MMKDRAISGPAGRIHHPASAHVPRRELDCATGLGERLRIQDSVWPIRITIARFQTSPRDTSALPPQNMTSVLITYAYGLPNRGLFCCVTPTIGGRRIVPQIRHNVSVARSSNAGKKKNNTILLLCYQARAAIGLPERNEAAFGGGRLNFVSKLGVGSSWTKKKKKGERNVF